MIEQYTGGTKNPKTGEMMLDSTADGPPNVRIQGAIDGVSNWKNKVEACWIPKDLAKATRDAGIGLSPVCHSQT